MLMGIQGCLERGYTQAALYAHKTSSSTLGHQKFTRLSVSILKLSNAIFPVYKEALGPLLEALTSYKNFCYATMIIPSINKIVQTKKFSIANISHLFVSCSLTVKFLKDVNVLSFSSMAKVSDSTGTKEKICMSIYACFFQKTTTYIAKNFNHIGISIEACWVITAIFIKYYKASNNQTRTNVLSNETMLLLANRTGKLIIAGFYLANIQASVFIACIDVGVSLAGYARFLISKK